MINGLVLSKNRASQLRLLLESIKLNANNFFSEINIVYTFSDEKYKEGYEKLKSEKILKNLIWKEEENFVQDFLDSLQSCKTKYICGIVDDCIFYKRVPLSSGQVCSIIDSDDNIFCFSLRLGLNTYIQNHITQTYMPLWTIENPLPPSRNLSSEDMLLRRGYAESPSCLAWNWSERNWTSNYGYPISLDGHIYRSEEMYKLSSSIKNGEQGINNLRHWESQLAKNIIHMTQKVKMASFKQSCVVCSANNCVQDPPMVSGAIHPFSEQKLNDMYLNDGVIDIEQMEIEFQNINSAHTEFSFRFKRL